jgi:hypothetical protein
VIAIASETRARQRQPAGQQAQRNDQNGVTQREEQRRDNNHADDPHRLRGAHQRSEHRGERGNRDHRQQQHVSRPQWAVDAAGHHRAAQGKRADAADEQQLPGARPPVIARPGQLDEHCEPCHAGDGHEEDLQPAEQMGVRSGGCAHRVQRHHQRETTQSDRGQHQNRLARIAGQQVQPEPAAQCEHDRRQRSHATSLSRRYLPYLRCRWL